ncbi:hypothetical protein DLM75_00855 [Leptospira stimsonii]|uniref:Uncharacterized protein n=1 Tax=Leptospira stimsonii TaxID=2202203 RepID=A0A396Z8T3_9LEPT|nr:hypothetical protein DLM75_00855 [Leptospira stimsonii]
MCTKINALPFAKKEKIYFQSIGQRIFPVLKGFHSGRKKYGIGRDESEFSLEHFGLLRRCVPFVGTNQISYTLHL